MRTCSLRALQAEQGSQNVGLNHADHRAALVAAQFDAVAFHGGNDAAPAIDTWNRLMRNNGHLAGQVVTEVACTHKS